MVYAFGIIGIDHDKMLNKLLNELQPVQDRRPPFGDYHGGNGRLRGRDPAHDLSAAHGAQVLLWSQSVRHDCPTTSTTSWRYIFYLDGCDACDARDVRRGVVRCVRCMLHVCMPPGPPHAACMHARSQQESAAAASIGVAAAGAGPSSVVMDAGP